MSALKIFNFFRFPKKSVQVIDLQGFEKLPDDFATSKIALAEDVFESSSNGLSYEERIAKFKREIEKARKQDCKELNIRI